MNGNLTNAQAGMLRVGGSVKTLITAIVTSVYCLLGLISIFVENDSMSMNLLSNVGLGSVRAVIVIILIILLLPMCFLALALWVIWAQGRAGKVSTLGYSFGMVTIIMKLIGILIAAIAVLAAIFSGGKILNASTSPERENAVVSSCETGKAGMMLSTGDQSHRNGMPVAYGYNDLGDIDMDDLQDLQDLQNELQDELQDAMEDVQNNRDYYSGRSKSYNNNNWYSKYTKDLEKAWTLVIILAIIFIVLAVFWGIMMLLSVIRMRRVMKTGWVTGKVSMYAIVMNFILAALYTFSFVMVIANGNGEVGVGMFSQLSNIIYIVMITLLFIDMRGVLNAGLMSQQMPYQGQPAMGQQMSYQGQSAMGQQMSYQGQPAMDQQMPYQGQSAMDQQMPYQGFGGMGQSEDSVTVPGRGYEPGVGMGTAVGKLEGLEGLYKGAQIDIEPGVELLIGRDESVVNLVIKNPKVSRKHCGIRFNPQDGSYTVMDYSSNGLFYKNGKEFPKNTPVICKAGTILVVARSGNEFMLK